MRANTRVFEIVCAPKAHVDAWAVDGVRKKVNSVWRSGDVVKQAMNQLSWTFQAKRNHLSIFTFYSGVSAGWPVFI